MHSYFDAGAAPRRVVGGEYNEDESLQLLLEIVTQDPLVQQALKVVQGTCLSRGIFLQVRGKQMTKKFEQYVNMYYKPFCENSLRCMFLCGFVPWRLRRLHTGDIVPEVLPVGSFSWFVESCYDSGSKDTRYRYHDSTTHGASSKRHKSGVTIPAASTTRPATVHSSVQQGKTSEAAGTKPAQKEQIGRAHV